MFIDSGSPVADATWGVKQLRALRTDANSKSHTQTVGHIVQPPAQD
jgi:hypothetical protein